MNNYGGYYDITLGILKTWSCKEWRYFLITNLTLFFNIQYNSLNLSQFTLYFIIIIKNGFSNIEHIYLYININIDNDYFIRNVL